MLIGDEDYEKGINDMEEDKVIFDLYDRKGEAQKAYYMWNVL